MSETLKHLEIIGTVGYMGGIMSVPEPFCYCWGQMVEYNQFGLCNPGERVHYVRSRLGLHDYGRNELAGKMEGDWLMMLDTDIQFEPDTVARLVRLMYANNLDVVTGIYQFKSHPFMPVLYHFNDAGDRYEILGRWEEDTDLFPVDSAGAGCLLIRRRVFERIRDELKENPFNREGIKGEDHCFFERLRKLAIPAYCAWKVSVNHLAYRPIALTDRALDAVQLNSYEVCGLKGVIAMGDAIT